MITARTMQRLELWSGLQCAGGARLAILGDIVSAKAGVALSGDDKLTVVLPIDHAQRDAITFWRALRVVESDAVYDEWVITDRAAAESDATLTVTAQPAEQYLGRKTLVGLVDGLGNVSYDISDLGLTPHDHLTSRLLPWLTAQGIAWVELGTIDPTVTIDMTLAWDGPLAYLQRLASTAGAEFQFRRVDAAHYAIDLLTAIGSTAPVADFRRRKNLQGLTESGTAAEQVTRVYPRGAQGDAGYASMATALWQVTAIAGSVVTLADPAAGPGPILEDDQLNGIYLRRPDGTLVAVADSAAAGQTVTLAAAPGFAMGDYVGFARDAAGTALTYLDSPLDIIAAGGAPQGVIAGVLDVPDVVATANLVPNPAGRLWGGALPDGWATVGAPTSVTKQTVAPYVQAAGVSMHVVATHDGDGVVSPAAPVRPSSATPYGSGFGVLWVVSGQVRVELVVTDSHATVTVLPISPAVASSTVLGQWDSLGVAGEDLNAMGAVSVAVRVVQHGAGAAEFYVDGAQVTQTAEQDPFLEGTGGTRLWQAANERLRANGAPASTYTSDILDRARLDPATYGADSALVLGGTVRVTDDTVLAGVVSTRVVSLERDYIDVGNGSFTLSTLPSDLGGALARPATPPRPSSTVGLASSVGAPSALIRLVSQIQDRAVISLEGTPGYGAGAHLDYRWRVSASNGVMPAWGAWITAGADLPQVETVFRYPTLTAQIELDVRGSDGQIAHAPTVTLQGEFRPTDVGTGLIDRRVQQLDGAYAASSTTGDGYSLHANVANSVGAGVNRLYAKSLPSDPDTADAINAGIIRRVPLDGATDSSGNIDLGGSAWVNRTLAHVADDPTSDRHAVTANQGTGATRGFAALDTGNRLVTSVAEGATIGVESAATISKKQGGFFREVFNALPDANNWNFSQIGALSLVSGQAIIGANVLQSVGQTWMATPRMAFSPNALYRFRLRVRCTVDSTGGQVCYVGCQAFLSNGSVANNNGGWCYVVAEGLALAVADGWVELTTWVKGASFPFASGSPGPFGTDATIPQALNVGTAFISPMIGVGYPGGAGVGTYQVDYYIIDEYDEDGAHRAYAAVDVNGDVQRAVPLVHAVANVPSLDGATGRVKRSVPLDDGIYSLKATDAGGVVMDSNVVESGGKLANRLYAKALSSDPDSADGISNGVAFRITSLTEAAGGGYAAIGLQTNGDVARDVPLARAVANVAALSSADGKLDPSIALHGTTGTPVHTQHNVSALANGATVEDGSARARGALDTNNRLADQSHNVMLAGAGVSALQSTNLILTCGGSSGNWTISIAAHAVQFGFGQVSYHSGSVHVTFNDTTFFIYATDPTFAGGAVTYLAVEPVQFLDVASDQGNYYVGAIRTPASSGSSTGSTGGSGSSGGYQGPTPV